MKKWVNKVGWTEVVQVKVELPSERSKASHVTHSFSVAALVFDKSWLLVAAQ